MRTAPLQVGEERQHDQESVTNVDKAALRAIRLPSYIDASNSGAQNIMISFSCGGMDQTSTDDYQVIVASVNSGVDMNMVPTTTDERLT